MGLVADFRHSIRIHKGGLSLREAGVEPGTALSKALVWSAPELELELVVAKRFAEGDASG
jgi:hypothetical protein